jgi:hypothetical protein
LRAFTVKAKSLESAQRLFDALRRFAPSLDGSPSEGYSVSVDVAANPQRLAEVLTAIQDYAHEQDRATRVELDGRVYTVEPT